MSNPPNQANILFALHRSSTRPKPVGVPRAQVGAGTVRDLVVLAGASASDPDAVLDQPNAHDLLCPRPGCGSIIIKAQTAGLRRVPRTTVVLEPRTNTHAHLAPLPEADEANVEVWRITPNEMAFENIGLTHDVPSPGAGTDGPARKLLACAECDLGPLGWHVVGTSEFWLVADRVGYRVAA
ncbi:Mss4-like protein [Auriculariales sp. MPI-PUGE-AT-0066]|nr:Mss4-like protein [Auriculariales sp. MPI-PUGE-AT-0066]